MKKIYMNTMWSFLAIVIASIGVSLTIKANVGTGSINALSGSISTVTSIKIGTILMLVNALCILVQWVIQKKEFHFRQWLQVITAMLLGEVVNIMVYQLLNNWVLDVYWLRVVVLIIGVCISCFAIGMLVRLNLVVFPIEACAMVIAQYSGWTFKKVRQGIDVVAILLSLAITFIADVPLTVREGTLLNLLIFSHIAHYFIERIEHRKWFETIRIK
ncbi:YitT family protein [Carnobacteriaceae bacterium zg-C25]|nr:YitT family protein [Carnobacteriaceae bacterium zg-C25]